MTTSNTCENAAPDDIFKLILEGGDSFVDRVKVFQNAKAEHDKSLKALQLGGQARNAEIEAGRAEAAKVVAKAEADAHKIKADAKVYAEKLIAQANAEKSQADAHIAQLKRDAEDWVKQHKADLVGKIERLKAAVRAVE
jgi:hypothetical protein